MAAAAQGHTPTLLLDPPLSFSFALKLQTPKRRIWGKLNLRLARSGCNSAPRLNFGNVGSEQEGNLPFLGKKINKKIKNKDSETLNPLNTE